jgi:hypothetical protein
MSCMLDTYEMWLSALEAYAPIPAENIEVYSHSNGTSGASVIALGYVQSVEIEVSFK